MNVNLNSDFTQKPANPYSTHMFSRYGAGQTVHFMVLNKKPNQEFVDRMEGQDSPSKRLNLAPSSGSLNDPRAKKADQVKSGRYDGRNASNAKVDYTVNRSSELGDDDEKREDLIVVKNERPLEEIMAELSAKFQSAPLNTIDMATRASVDESGAGSRRESTEELVTVNAGGSSSFLSISREKLAKLKKVVTAGDHNFGKYRVKYHGVDRRLPYENLTFNRKAQPIVRIFDQKKEVCSKQKGDVR